MLAGNPRLITPPDSYLGSVFPDVLRQPNVEYRQANLTVAGTSLHHHFVVAATEDALLICPRLATVASCFDPPAGQEPYDYVFDFTGEIQPDRPEGVSGPLSSVSTRPPLLNAPYPPPPV